MIVQYKGSKKDQLRKRRHKRIRGKIHGNATVPRVCTFRSLKHIYAQVVDDDRGITVASSSDVAHAFTQDDSMTKTAKAFEVGKVLGGILREKGITTVVFDRGGYKYHGRVRALAEGIRSTGIAL